MAEQNNETTEGTAQSKEIVRFHRALAIVNSNAILRATMSHKIEKVTEDLIRFANTGHKCPPGTIWDHASGECVKI